MATTTFESFDADVDGVLAAASRKRRRDEPGSPKAKRKAKIRKETASRVQAASHPMPGGSGGDQGLITLGVGALFRSMAAARRIGLWPWLSAAALAGVLALSAVAWMQAPPPAPLQGIRFEGVKVPVLLQEQWLRSFHGFDRLRRSPDREVLDAFATHLAERPSVESVSHVELVWIEHEADRPPVRQIEVALTMRRPLLPVRLGDGHRAWVDGDGVVLSPLLPGPKGEPIVRGYESGGSEAMGELLAVWPRLREALPADLVVGVDLDHPLGSGGRRGIVFHTRPGAKLIWGAPGEDRFGLTRERKIRNLVHTLSCQGDLSQVEAINVRFPGAFVVDPDESVSVRR